MKLSAVACYGFCLAAGAFLAHYELHTDDTGLEVGYIVLVTFILGCWHPRRAWQWALLVGPWAPAADCVKWLGGHAPEIHGAGGLAGVALVVILLGLAGSYAGALLRRAVKSLA
jgi:hypothetical protein